MPTLRVNYVVASALKRSQQWFIGVPIYNQGITANRLMTEVNGHRPNEGYIGSGDKNSAEAFGFTEECCGMSSMLLLALCFSRNAEQNKLARILHELTIEFTQNMIKLFWVQQLCTASCLGRCAGSWEAAAMPRIFSSQLAINFGTFSPSNFSMIGSRKVLFGKIRRELVGWTRHRGFIKLGQE